MQYIFKKMVNIKVSKKTKQMGFFHFDFLIFCLNFIFSGASNVDNRGAHDDHPKDDRQEMIKMEVYFFDEALR